MPNVKSAKKRVKTNLRDTLRNTAARSALRTAIKKVHTALGAGEPAAVQSSLLLALSTIGRSTKKGIIHANKAARQESRLVKRVNAFLAAKSE